MQRMMLADGQATDKRLIAPEYLMQISKDVVSVEMSCSRDSLQTY